MIINKNGDIFNGDENMICHQVNCLGIMGGGIASTIRKKFPQTYIHYNAICKNRTPEELLGKVLFYNENNRVIANCFGQASIGTSEVQTNYEKLEQCLKKVERDAWKRHLTVAIPYKIGCGLAGGDWQIVEKMIKDIFENSPVVLTIYKL